MTKIAMFRAYRIGKRFQNDGRKPCFFEGGKEISFSLFGFIVFVNWRKFIGQL
jgi:hypothetical protein